MVSVGEIEKVREEIQKHIVYLRNFNEEYKKSIDNCNPAGISSHAYFIARKEDDLRSLKDHMTIKELDELDNLEREYVLQFRRLNLDNVCECEQKVK